MSRILLVHLLLAAGLFSGIRANAQCCAAGNPSCDNGLDEQMGAGHLDATLSYHYSYSDTYYRGAERSDFKYMKNSFFRFTNLRMDYGLTPKWRVGMSMGYFISKAQTFESGYFREAVGLGDLTLSANYRLLRTEHLMLSPLVNISIPLGDFDQKFGNVVLPIDLQPSAGSMRTALGMVAAYRLSTDWSLAALGTYERSEPIRTPLTTYRYGGLADLRLMANYAVHPKWTLGMQSWLQVRERATDLAIPTLDTTTGEIEPVDRTVNASGGEVLFLCPELSWKTGNWTVSTLYEHPVYKRMNGLQLTNKHRFMLRVTHSFALKKTPVPDPISPSLKLAVSGACGMCKSRIEGIALNQHGVILAHWDQEIDVLSLETADGFDQDALIQALLEAGHDSEGFVADDAAYEALHSCCKYRPIAD